MGGRHERRPTSIYTLQALGSGCIPLLARPILLCTGQYIVQNYDINKVIVV